jgi:hypothetical protein
MILDSGDGIAHTYERCGVRDVRESVRAAVRFKRFHHEQLIALRFGRWSR